MPLTVEPGVFPAYVVDHLTGKTFQVGAPLPAHNLDVHTDVDLTTTPPVDGEALIWSSTATDAAGIVGQWIPGSSGIGYWDPTVNYEIGDFVLWPDVPPGSLWEAQLANLNEEPLPSTTQPPNGVVFPGAAGGGAQLSAQVNVDITAGFDIRVQTDGTVGTGILVDFRGAGYPYFYLEHKNAGFLQAVLHVGVGFTSDRALADFPSLNWVRVVVTASTFTFYSSVDGVTWTEVGTPSNNPVGLGTVSYANFPIIGADGNGDAARSYAGKLRAVEVYKGGAVTTPLTSWVRTTQPDALGAGVSPKTGETYAAYDPNGLLLDDPPLGTPSSWLEILSGSSASNIDGLLDVDTSTTPPVDGQVLIWSSTAADAVGTVGQWIPGAAANTLDDLLDVQTIGLTSHPAGPVQGESLIFDAATGLWYPSPDPHIVLTSADEPTLPDGTPVPDGTIWLNPEEIVPVEPPIRVIDDLLDVDTVTTPPVQGDSLVFDANLGQWMPAVATRKFVSTVAIGALGPTPIVHNLGLTEVLVAVYINNVQIAAGVAITDLNTVTIDFGTTATIAAATVIVMG